VKILISHVSDEALFALLLKDFIESTFLGQFEVNLSSNSTQSGVGDKWLVELDSSLTSADLMLVLCSPKSIRQPWIHFEFGCAWTKSMQITCICHSGLSKIDLPSHLRTFEILEVEDDDFMERLFNDLAKRFGIKRLPRLSYETMKAELRATLVSISPAVRSAESAVPSAEYKTSAQTAAEPVIPPPEVDAETVSPEKTGPHMKEEQNDETMPVLDEDGLEDQIDSAVEEKLRQKEEPSEPSEPSEPEPQPRSSPAVVIKKKWKKRRKKKEEPAKPESVQRRVLRLLAEAGGAGYPLEDLSDLLGIIGPKLEPYLDALKEQEYITIAVEVGRPPEYKIAAKGEQYLTESKAS
jgi:hypothetical protein